MGGYSGALLSLHPSEFCPTPDLIPLQITGCCLQFPFLPIKTALLALECSLLEHLCVCFSCPLPKSLEFSLPGGCLKITVSFINGLIGLLLSLILASHVQLGCLWVPAL